MYSDSLLTTDVLPIQPRSDLERLEPQITGSQSLASATADDRRIDILWRNRATGENETRSLDGGNAAKSQPLPNLSSDYQLAGIGDFNGDRQDDLVWWNSLKREVSIWTMNGETVQKLAIPQIPAPDWHITNVGDFDQDGKTDLLWHNDKTGASAFWLLDGTNFRSGVYLSTVSDLNWGIQTVADFNSDGSLDIQWRNTQTGVVDIWLLNKTERSQSATFGAIDLNWTIEGVGDFDHDRHPDLLWRNGKTGENAIWFLNGTQRKQSDYLPSKSVDWQIISAADLNNDSNLDVLWYNRATGESSRWLLNQGTFSREDSLGTTPDLNWQPLGTLSRSDRSQSSLASPSATPVVTETTAALAQNDSLSIATVESSPIFALNDQVSSGNSSDLYQFSLGQSGIFTANLTGLTGDADIKLIQDANSNGTIDSTEVLAYQWERGTASEALRRFLNPGTYYIQVLSYRDQTAAYSVATNFTAAAQDDQKFRLNLTFGDGLSGLSQAAQTAIREAGQFWENIITNRSAITEGNDLNITLLGQNLVTQNGTADTSTLALSGPTFGISAANTLVLRRGTSTINTRKLADFEANPAYLRSTMIHEFAHILGFGTAWEPVEFVDYDGTRFKVGKNFIDRTTVTYAANTYAGYAYGDLLGTGTPTAVPIEAGALSHWDETRFDTELMTPYAESQGVPTPLSAITLGALRDLGWSVNMGAVEAYVLPQAAPQTVVQPLTIDASSVA
jgi:hypothetical protein